jgi:hypothetical protein
MVYEPDVIFIFLEGIAMDNMSVILAGFGFYFLGLSLLSRRILKH